MKSIQKKLALITVFFLFTLSTISGQNLIVNGTNEQINGGTFNNIIIINDGFLKISGDVTTNVLHVEYGRAEIYGNLIVNDSLYLVANPAGTITVYGNNNYAAKVNISGGEFSILGVWKGSVIKIKNNAQLRVITFQTAYPGSGLLELDYSYLESEPQALITANGAGIDPRGEGTAYRDVAGGGYGGKGGRGFYADSKPGNVYGNHYDTIIDMGGRGAYNGGGGLKIVADSVNLQGKVRSDGINSLNNSGGAGSGGGVMLIVNKIISLQSIKARGGNGNTASEPTNTNAGGGGGGRIKIHYGSKSFSYGQISSMFNVDGGHRGGYRNTQPGENGTVFVNFIPQIPEIFLPVNNDSLPSGFRPIFSFSALDSSGILDNRNENLTAKIIMYRLENNRWNFFKTYLADSSLVGWSKIFYTTGDTVRFACPDSLPDGVYQWTAHLKDRSIWNLVSPVYQFTLGNPVTVEIDKEALFSANLYLLQNYPNPFNPQTTIGFYLPSAKQVKLSIYNMLGQEIVNLINSFLPAGEHKIIWDGRNQSGQNVAAGAYAYVLLYDNQTIKKKMILIR